jgi:acyl-CoA synthetase (AMP-forming)/AMP-acid ligase II
MCFAIALLAVFARPKLSIIELKKFCSENLPLYMVPDLFCSLESLPKTSTDKIDYQKLNGMK